MVQRTSSRADPIRAAALPIREATTDLDPILDVVGDARFVLLGEASHGTHDFHRLRAAITKRLVRERGFDAIAVEADWPHAYRVNRWIRLLGDDPDAERALSGFQRFPTWMWRNADVLDLVGWLRAHNERLPSSKERVGFYGLDLYSLHDSIAAVIAYLEKVDPEEAKRARDRYGCLDHAQSGGIGYELTARWRSCEHEVVAQLVSLQRRADEYLRRDGRVLDDDHFYAEQNALLAKNAESYYRTSVRGGASSWNLRDRHMCETLEALAHHLRGHGREARIVVWAHNSHLGDARATAMHEWGELNLGQLVRESHGNECALIGFTTYGGTVTAAADWDEPAQRMVVRPALPNSHEALLHEAGLERFIVRFDREGPATELLREERLERFIGVVYRPGSERRSHYYEARLATQFDAVIHVDESRAVEPLERGEVWTDELPETFPYGV